MKLKSKLAAIVAAATLFTGIGLVGAAPAQAATGSGSVTVSCGAGLRPQLTLYNRSSAKLFLEASPGGDRSIWVYANSYGTVRSLYSGTAVFRVTATQPGQYWTTGSRCV